MKQLLGEFGFFCVGMFATWLCLVVAADLQSRF